MRFRHPNQERSPSKQGVRLGPYFGVGDNLVTLGQGVGGWSPSALGASLLEWWVADRADLFTLSGAQVSSWRGAVQGTDAASALSGERPIYSATSFNGSPGVFGDGIDDNLTFTAPANFPTGSAGGEIWALVQQDALPADTGVRVAVRYGGNTSISRGLERTVSAGVNKGTARAGAVVSSAPPDFSGRNVIRAIITPTDVTPEVNQIAGAPAAVVPATATGIGRLFCASPAGATLFWSGLIREVLFTQPLTVQDAASLNTYLLARRNL